MSSNKERNPYYIKLSMFHHLAIPSHCALVFVGRAGIVEVIVYFSGHIIVKEIVGDVRCCIFGPKCSSNK